MWLLKGFAAGLLVFLLVAFLYVKPLFPTQPNTAMSLGFLKVVTVDRPIFWVTFILILFASCSAFKLLGSMRITPVR